MGESQFRHLLKFLGLLGVNLSLLINEWPKNLVNARWNSKNGPKFASHFVTFRKGAL